MYYLGKKRDVVQKSAKERSKDRKKTTEKSTGNHGKERKATEEQLAGCCGQHGAPNL
jgi:hypothetical protein